MHTVSFEMKQAHLAALRLGRKETEAVGLTPARLDMLRAIMEGSGGSVQAKLRELLCVTKPVISVMVRALEKLGFVVRKRSSEDRRTFVLTLTDKAKNALRRVYYESITLGYLKLGLMWAFCKPGTWSVRSFEIAIHRLHLRLNMFRCAFGIGDTRYNPWEINEDDEGFFYADVPGNPNRLDIVPSWDEEDHAGVEHNGTYDHDPTAPADWAERQARDREWADD